MSDIKEIDHLTEFSLLQNFYSCWKNYSKSSKADSKDHLQATELMLKVDKQLYEFYRNRNHEKEKYENEKRDWQRFHKGIG